MDHSLRPARHAGGSDRGGGRDCGAARRRHSPASSGIYLGAPSIAILPSGEYVASLQEFGPKSSMLTSGLIRVYRSGDGGQSWKQVAEVDGQFCSTLFVHRGALYLLGASKNSGNAVIARAICTSATAAPVIR